jgi:hypothetical protein
MDTTSIEQQLSVLGKEEQRLHAWAAELGSTASLVILLAQTLGHYKQLSVEAINLAHAAIEHAGQPKTVKPRAEADSSEHVPRVS